MNNSMTFGMSLYDEKGGKSAGNVIEKRLDKDVFAVFADGASKLPLDSETGAIIDIKSDGFEGATAVYRHSEFWCIPYFTDKENVIPDETQMLLLKKGNMYTCILPVVSELYRCVLVGGDNIKARLFTWCTGIQSCKCLAFVYKTSESPYIAVHDCFEQAVKVLGNDVKMREERDYPEVFEYLGWCSWDAMQIRVNEEGLLEKCREFADKDIPVKWAIIDDMWGDVPKFRTEKYSTRQEMFALMHSSPLASFNASPDRFPNGLAHTINEMKKYMPWVGMWHPTTGYWFGVDPNSDLYEQFGDKLYKTSDGRYIPKPDYDGFHSFIGAFHKSLYDAGADFVKVDNQSITRMFYKGTRPVGAIARDEQNAIEDSSKKYFGNRLINCMGCASDNIWNRKESAISRCSDDFQPENRDWFTKHILECCFVSLFQGQIINCDWDMWWTDDGQAIKNSVLRAISGGPVYVSDEIGRSRREILMPLVLSDGRILRCKSPATPTVDSLFGSPEENGRAFKVQNLCGTSGAVAAFNLDGQNRAVTGTISPDDVNGLEGTEFAVYEHFSHKFFVLKKGERMEVNLSSRDDFRLYTITPIIDGFAVIGLTDKFMSPLTVKSQHGREFELFEGGKYAVYEDGRFIEK